MDGREFWLVVLAVLLAFLSGLWVGSKTPRFPKSPVHVARIELGGYSSQCQTEEWLWIEPGPTCHWPPVIGAAQ